MLASLNHPGIARLLDAGHTEGGLPYMVMDYVEGTPLDAYCRNLDLRAKLELFLKIASALAYAHRNLVIHRDLKPSNILVNAAGEPVLLDFGIARMLDDAPSAGVTTELILTPEYASPEQVRGTAYTTATDIYSLGALLYHLLTEHPPHERTSGSAVTVEELICRREPAAPSRLNPNVPRDLDFIVGKALRKEPEERYTAVDAMAEDVRAFLESRPVRARSGNAWYRTRKFLRRRWLPVTVAAAAAALLTAGLIEVTRERTIAQHRFQQLQNLANQVLLFDDEIKQLPGATKARQKMVTVSMAYLDGLGREARGDPDIALSLAHGYIQLAKVQGVPSFPNLGQLPEAESSLAKAESYVQVALKKDSGDPVAMANAAEISELRLIVADTRHRDAEAIAFAGQCAARLDALLRNPRAGADVRRNIVSDRINLANGYMNQHHFAEAVQHARRSVELGKQYGAPPDIQAAALSLLANALRQSGDLDGALAAITESRKTAEDLSFSSEVRKGSMLYPILWRQGQILGSDSGVSLGRRQEAIEPFQRAFDLMDALASKDPNDSLSRDRVGTAAQQLGDTLRHSDPRRALEVFDRAILRQREIPTSIRARRTEARLLAHSSYPLRQLHRSGEAADRVAAAFRLLQDTKDYPAAQIRLSSEASDAILALADLHTDGGNTQQARIEYRDLLEKTLAAKPTPETDLMDAAGISRIYTGLAGLDRRTGNSGEAAEIEARRLALWHAWQTRMPGNAYVERQLRLFETTQ
jgi:tetratricopeptide (TPR) repeat protein